MDNKCKLITTLGIYPRCKNSGKDYVYTFSLDFDFLVPLMFMKPNNLNKNGVSDIQEDQNLTSRGVRIMSFVNRLPLYRVPMHVIKSSFEWMRGSCIQFACIHTDHSKCVWKWVDT